VMGVSELLNSRITEEDKACRMQCIGEGRQYTKTMHVNNNECSLPNPEI